MHFSRCAGVWIYLSQTRVLVQERCSSHRVVWLLWKRLGSPPAVLVQRTPGSCYAAGNSGGRQSSPRGWFGSVPKEESPGSVCSDERAAHDNVGEMSEDSGFVVSSALWSEGTKRLVPPLPCLSLQQSWPKSLLKRVPHKFLRIQNMFLLPRHFP